MAERQFHHALAVAWIVAAAATAAILIFVAAPYGRHARPGWGPRMNATVAWVVMEAVSPLGMAILFALGDRPTNPVAVAFLAMWLVHYVHRAFVFPFRRRGAREMPVAVALLAVVFNAGNAYLNGRDLFLLGPTRDIAWFGDPRFVAGIAIFAAGLVVNVRSDRILFSLRRPGETTYRIPRGGLFDLVSCPNYLGEIVEWIGWAIATWSVGGATFAIWTAANLVPRAVSHHRWYRSTFPDYPSERRAIVPFVL